jgi:hypothetical protein
MGGLFGLFAGIFLSTQLRRFQYCKNFDRYPKINNTKCKPLLPPNKLIFFKITCYKYELQAKECVVKRVPTQEIYSLQIGTTCNWYLCNRFTGPLFISTALEIIIISSFCSRRGQDKMLKCPLGRYEKDRVKLLDL